MDKDRYQRIRELLHEASELPAAGRAAFLADACGGDDDLRREVEDLLRAPTVATGGLVPPLPDAVPGSLGSYRIVREIGRGGMGAVYEARTAADERVALKVVHPHYAGLEWFQERFEREARVGLAVDHPNVVRTLGVDRADDWHFLVMEYVHGKTLRALAAELGTVPESLLREVARQIAAGLDAIHAAGVVHRDLKPENVLIADDERVRIMDLGIAKLQDASVALTREGQFLGSLNYAAPEQCEFGAITPAADLYALGVILYELATGANPFAAESPGATIRAHLDARPRPAAEVNPDLSAFFSVVVATLLAKAPADRFASGGALGEALAAGEGGDWWKGRERELRAGAPSRPRVPVRRETALQGRAAERRALEEAWGRARKGDGGAVVLEGEAGLGKSRLVDAFLGGVDDAHVLYGSYPPTGGLRGLVDAILAKFGRANLAESLALHLKTTPSLVPAFAAIVRRDTPVDALAGDAFPLVCTRLLDSLAAHRPTVWVMEDLHFAPEMGRTVALALARAAAGQRALVLLTSREPLRATGVQRVPLARLTKTEVERMLEEALPDRARADVAAVVAKSDGVPFFVLELVRSVREDGTLDVPSAVRDLIAARLGGLRKHERAILDVGAVYGYEFDVDLVAAALERPVVSVLQELAEIERRRALVRPAGRRIRFDHHQIQEVLYADLPERLRAEYHTRLADRYGEATEGADAHFVASHHLRGVRPEAGLEHLDRALAYVDQHFRHEEAVVLLQRAVAASAGAERAEALLDLVDRLHIVGRRDEQRAAIAEALALARELEDDRLRARSFRREGVYRFVTSRSQEAIASFTRAAELARRAGDRACETRATLGIGTAYAQQNSHGKARRHLERAHAMAIDLDDLDTQVHASAYLGLILGEQCEFDRALALFRDTVDVSRRHGRTRWLPYAETNIGVIHLHRGEFAEADAHQRRAIEIAREVCDPRAEQTATCNLGLVCWSRGRLAEALELFERFEQGAREISNPQGAVIADLNAGLVEAHLGRRDAARRRHERARDVAQAQGLQRQEASALLYLAEATGSVGMGERGLGILERLNQPHGIAGAHLALGRLALRLKKRAAAVRHFEACRDVSERIGIPSQVFVADAFLAALGREPPALDPARRCTRIQELEARFALWNATGDRTHLEAAHGVVELMRSHAPPEDRDPMLTNVRLFRDVAEAWKGGRGI